MAGWPCAGRGGWPAVSVAGVAAGRGGRRRGRQFHRAAFRSSSGTHAPADMDCNEFFLPDELVDARPADTQHLCGLGNTDERMSYGRIRLVLDSICGALGSGHAGMVISGRHVSLPYVLRSLSLSELCSHWRATSDRSMDATHSDRCSRSCVVPVRQHGCGLFARK